MASSSAGNSSGSTPIQNSGSEEDLQVLMDQRKRKRMQSNRESARRSRMRKQKHLDDLMVQVTQLMEDNNKIHSSIDNASQRYQKVEAENLILRAQMVELSQRLQSLNEILNYINTSSGIFETDHNLQTSVDVFNNPLNSIYLNQRIMASPDMLQY